MCFLEKRGRCSRSSTWAMVDFFALQLAATFVFFSVSFHSFGNFCSFVSYQLDATMCFWYQMTVMCCWYRKSGYAQESHVSSCLLHLLTIPIIPQADNLYRRHPATQVRTIAIEPDLATHHQDHHLQFREYNLLLSHLQLPGHKTESTMRLR